MKDKTLQTLLDIELERLKIAVEFEKSKKIVFPETSMIIRDILRIEEKMKIKLSGPEKPIKFTTKPKKIKDTDFYN